MRFKDHMRIRVWELYAARYEPEAFRRLASAYWHFLLFLTAILSAAGITYGVFAFLGAHESPTSSVTVQAPQASFTKQQLEEVLRGIEARAQQFEERREKPLTIPDPS